MAAPQYTTGQIIKAWSPFLIMTGLVIIWGLPAAKKAMDVIVPWKFYWPGLNKMVIQAAPIVKKATPMVSLFKLNLLSAAGTALFLSCIISAIVLGVKGSQFMKILGDTASQLKKPFITIPSVLGLAYIMNYSGASSTLGLFLAGTGFLFPFFSAFLGWLGVFLTGSDTSANALFGNLQAVTATQVGMDPVLAVAANSSGGVTGKMISPQSIAVATASTGLVGQEGELFRFTVLHSLVLGTIIGLMTMAQTYWLTWMIPH
jgi:lactate permease